MSHVNRLSLTQLLSSRCGDLTRFEPELSLQLFQWRGHQFFGLTSRFSRISFRELGASASPDSPDFFTTSTSFASRTGRLRGFFQ